jgi:hypothetical protein
MINAFCQALIAGVSAHTLIRYHYTQESPPVQWVPGPSRG